MGKSSKILPTIEIFVSDKNHVDVKLRRNFQKIETVDLLTEEKQIDYTFEEVVISVNQQPNLLQRIEQNFDAWFEKGLTFEKLSKETQEKQKEMDKLINDYEQLNLNMQLKTNNLTAFQSIGSLYTENMRLKTENTKLKTQNLNSMMAIAELYTLLGGQTNG